MELMIIAAIFLISFILIGAQVINRKKRTRRQQYQGVVDISRLTELITLIQQHRGLTAALLNGDSQVSEKIDHLRAKVSNVAATLSASNVVQNERWLSFKDHWKRLIASKLVRQIALNSIQQ